MVRPKERIPNAAGFRSLARIARNRRKRSRPSPRPAKKVAAPLANKELERVIALHSVDILPQYYKLAAVCGKGEAMRLSGLPPSMTDLLRGWVISRALRGREGARVAHTADHILP